MRLSPCPDHGMTPPRNRSAPKLVEALFAYAEALLNADLSYTQLPKDDPRAAVTKWPITDSRVKVEHVIEADTWREELDGLRRRWTDDHAFRPDAGGICWDCVPADRHDGALPA